MEVQVQVPQPVHPAPRSGAYSIRCNNSRNSYASNDARGTLCSRCFVFRFCFHSISSRKNKESGCSMLAELLGGSDGVYG